MSDAPVYGKSYWEIVTGAYRKNTTARAALWVSLGMMTMAILAPLLANDRPIFFTGTMPGEYRKAYSQVTRGAFMAVLMLPARMKAEAAKFEDKSATLNDYLKRLTEAEAFEQYGSINRLRKRAEFRPDVRALWISREVAISQIEAELKREEQELPGQIEIARAALAGGSLTPPQQAKKRELLEELQATLPKIPGELAQIDAALRRIVRDMPTVYASTLADAQRGFRLKVREMSDQVDAERGAKGLAMAETLASIVGRDYLTTTEDRKPALQALLADLKETFDPEKVSLVPKRRWPLIDSLTWLDLFFIPALLGTILVFGPLTWWKLKHLAPMGRRWKLSWAIALAPAIIVSLGWLFFHEGKFETVSYKNGMKDGTVQATSSMWAPIRWRYDEVPDQTITDEKQRPPTAPDGEHLLGTDFLGRDFLSRMIWGSRVSLSIGFVSVAIALSIGVTLGALAGYYRGWVDIFISRVIEVLTCFPTFFLILAVVAFLPPSIFYVMLVLGFFGWMGIARLQRGEFLRLVNLDFVQSAIALGATRSRVMFRHILPNALAPVLVAASFGIAGAMLTESGLSFLGLGVQEPETSWGQILFTGRAYVTSGAEKWWTFTIPGVAIFIAVTCYNLVGDGVRDATDPRLKS